VNRRFLALDLETVPDEALVSAVGGEPSRPYAEQVGRLLAQRRATSGGRSDFLPLPYHRPVAACFLEAEEAEGRVRLTDVVAWTDGAGADEAAFLRQTWARVSRRTLVSFHGRGFDLPVLELRSLKLGVPAGRWFGAGREPGSREHLDLLDLLSNGRAAPGAPLDLYAKLLGLPGKEGIAGRDVHDLYARGALDRIAAYCMTDVVQTWLLFLRWRLLEGTLTADGHAASVRLAAEELPALFAHRLPTAQQEILLPWLERCALGRSAPAAAAPAPEGGDPAAGGPPPGASPARSAAEAPSAARTGGAGASLAPALAAPGRRRAS
jgi:predicted PolB exonuclease-like 3'-5' exonuclease